jgi:ribosomal protein S12 methylthiotransferase
MNLKPNLKDTYYIETLGCDKNTVESERISFALTQAGLTRSQVPDDADILIVNTCGFITKAKEESVEAILTSVELKTLNPWVRLIVTGCLAERYSAELSEEIPEIDFLCGCDHKRILDYLNLTPPSEPGRLLMTPSHYAYLKISEGCDKHCTFCAIPKIRGRQVSVPIVDLIEEAFALARSGVKELILVAQDCGDYGRDLYGKRTLCELLRKLDEIPNLDWIRLMYVYPETIDDELIETIKSSKKILHYIDIPFQHASDDILIAMNRPTTTDKIFALIERIRNQIPDMAIRSTFICGFPGETPEDIKKLGDFIRYAKLDRVGVFEFSPEEGTKAYDMSSQIDDEVKQERFEHLMEISESVSEQNLARFVDHTLNVLIEEPYEGEEGIYIARSYLDAPEVDGIVYVYTDKRLKIGELYEVTITDSLVHDLIART